MRKLLLAGLAIGMGGSLSFSPALADGIGRPTGVSSSVTRSQTVARGGAWGRRVDGRWAAGGNAPGGWNSYYRPVQGWSLPSYWINPAFYIADWRGYGLPAPAAGYGWSRYYDDAVLTDRYGRVIDARYGYDWDRFGGYDEDYGYGAPPMDEDYRDDRRDRGGNGVAGAVAGGIIGGVAGNVIAGRGNRTAGTLVGAGVGAIAGAAIADSSTRTKRRKGIASAGYARDARTPADYDGRWEGTWYGSDGRSYSGTYDGRFQGEARGASYATGPAYGYRTNGYASGGYVTSGGYASSYAVDYVAPTVVETTVTTEETTYSAVRRAAARKAVVRKARPRPRAACCPCGC